jgi:hypothetical protein
MGEKKGERSIADPSKIREYMERTGVEDSPALKRFKSIPIREDEQEEPEKSEYSINKYGEMVKD